MFPFDDEMEAFVEAARFAHSVGVDAAIVSDVGGNPSLILHGENGVVVPRGDSSALSGAIADLMDSPEKMRAMSRRAEEIFSECFTGESFAKHVEDVYRSVLKGA